MRTPVHLFALALAGTAACADPLLEDSQSPQAQPEMRRLVLPDAQYTLSGQVNRAVLFARDGESTEVFHVDNSASSSRIRLIADRALDGGPQMGAALEFDIRVNSSFSVGQVNADRAIDGTNFRDRRVEVWIEDTFGRVWMGKGWTASEGSAERDLSATWLVGYSDIASNGGGMRFRDETGYEANPRISEAFDNMDGLGRDVRLRYDTPRPAAFPMQLRLSATQGGKDAAIFYDGPSSGWTRIVGAVAYAHRRGGDVPWEDQISGSFSLLIGDSVSFTGAGGTQRNRSGDDPRRDARYFYGKLGYQRDFWSLGRTAFSVDIGQAHDLALRDDRARAAGLQFVQHLVRWTAEAYFGARINELERSGGDFDPIVTVMTGMRLRF